MMVIMMAAMIVFIVWVVRTLGDNNHPQHGNSSALTILKERYAKGEITKKQFEEMKEDIR